MITCRELTFYLDQYLACSQYTDYTPNGLQIEGTATIKKICTAVTASQDVIEKAAAMQADALLVHHGFFWKGEQPNLIGMKKNRIATLLQHDMNLFAYHLPLDCHLEIGNNACLAKLLGLSQVTQHTVHRTSGLLWIGEWTKPIQPEHLSEILENKLQQKIIFVSGQAHKNIQKIAFCSGAAQDFIDEAYQLGVDAYISGEISERTYYQTKELGIHYFACGHHATERFGIQALGEHLARTYHLSHQFIDSHNPF